MSYTKYLTCLVLPMDHDDVLQFAEFLGFKGSDADLFYESYYELDNEEYEYDNVIEDNIDGNY